MAQELTTLLRFAQEVRIEMSREYSDHPFCRQLITLKDEEALKDVAVYFGMSGRVEQFSGFLLSLLSPVWRARLCGEFSQGREPKLDLEEGEAEALMTVVELGCGGRVMRKGLEELMEVGLFSEKYQIDEVGSAVQEEMVRHLQLDAGTCLGLLKLYEKNGLHRLEEACRRIALENFDELMMTEQFMEMGEGMLHSLLADDRLQCGREELVFEGVLRWMNGGMGSEVRGEGLLETIRFPQMRGEYLMSSARSALRGSERLERLVLEAAGLKHLPRGEWEKHVKYLGSKAIFERFGRGVKWGEYGVRQNTQRLPKSNDYVVSLADGGDWVCSGLDDGSITVWNKTSLDLKHTLDEHAESVNALVVYDSWLVSASEDNCIRVWDVVGEQCVMTLEDHASGVRALAVSERKLLSGSAEGEIRVWILEGLPSTWWCIRTLHGDREGTCSLAWWGRNAVSGSGSGAIQVWDLSTGECVQTLQGHALATHALVVKECRLMSASKDKSVREWCLESGVCVKVIEAYPSESPQYIQSLVLSGLKLVGGSKSNKCWGCAGEVVVWDLDTWVEEQRLKQMVGQTVRSLLAMEGEVWGGVGKRIIVWGRQLNGGEGNGGTLSDQDEFSNDSGGDSNHADSDYD